MLSGYQKTMPTLYSTIADQVSNLSADITCAFRIIIDHPLSLIGLVRDPKLQKRVIKSIDAVADYCC